MQWTYFTPIYQLQVYWRHFIFCGTFNNLHSWVELQQIGLNQQQKNTCPVDLFG